MSEKEAVTPFVIPARLEEEWKRRWPEVPYVIEQPIPSSHEQILFDKRHKLYI